MLGKAQSLGCPNLANGTPNGTCLCENADFGNGIRDCTLESCPGGSGDLNAVVQYGLGYCKSGRLA